jgi:ketopantoate reductase
MRTTDPRQAPRAGVSPGAVRIDHGRQEVAAFTIAMFWRSHVARTWAIRAHGMRIESPEETLVERIATVDDPMRLTWTPEDVLLLAVKTQDAAAAMRDIPAHVPVVCLTDGILVG